MKNTNLILLVSSLLVTLFLFFIDEGNYHFEGLFKLINLVALSFYFIGIFVTKLILYILLRPKFSNRFTMPLVIFSGSVIGSFLVAGFFVIGIPALRTIG